MHMLVTYMVDWSLLVVSFAQDKLANGMFCLGKRCRGGMFWRRHIWLAEGCWCRRYACPNTKCSCLYNCGVLLTFWVNASWVESEFHSWLPCHDSTSGDVIQKRQEYPVTWCRRIKEILIYYPIRMLGEAFFICWITLHWYKF